MATGDAGTTGRSGHGITIVDAQGVIGVSQIGDIPLGEIPDERLTVEIAVANNDKSEISGLRIRTFMVRSGREDTISIQLGSDFRDVVIKPGELKTFKNSYSVPKQLKPGDYKIMTRVDSNVTSQEKKEDYTEFISSQVIKIAAYADSGGSIPVYSPNKIDTPGSYLVMRDINGGSKDNIFKITCSGVTIDGGGHVISGTPTGYTSGLYVDGGVVIKDIVIRNFVFDNVDFGVWLYRVESASITNCIFRNCTNIGLRFDQVRQSTITDNRFENDELALGLFQSSGNTILNNYFRSKFNAVVNEGQKNTWNTEPTPGENIIGGTTKAGNAWFDLNKTELISTTPDADNNGIVDAPYSINGVNIDYYPLSTGTNTILDVPVPLTPTTELNETQGTEPAVLESVNETRELEKNTTVTPISDTPVPLTPTTELNETPGTEPVVPESVNETQELEKNTTVTPVSEIPGDSVSVTSPLPEVSAVDGIDLTIKDINTTTSSCLNAEFPITTTIANMGNLETGTFALHYYLSEDTSITAADRDVGSLQVEQLLPMENKTFTGKIYLPSNVPTKYYSIGVIIDPAHDVYESNKQNNAKAFGQRTQITDCQ